MTTLEQLAKDLLDFFTLLPTGTRQRFVDEVVALDHATAGQAGWFVDKMRVAMADVGLIDQADWDAMMAKARSVTPSQRLNAVRAVLSVMRQLPEVRRFEINQRLGLLGDYIADLERKGTSGTLGRAEILTRFPAGTLRDDTVAVLDLGLVWVTGSKDEAERNRDRLLEELERLS